MKAKAGHFGGYWNLKRLASRRIINTTWLVLSYLSLHLSSDFIGNIYSLISPTFHQCYHYWMWTVPTSGWLLLEKHEKNRYRHFHTFFLFICDFSCSSSFLQITFKERQPEVLKWLESLWKNRREGEKKSVVLLMKIPILALCMGLRKWFKQRPCP